MFIALNEATGDYTASSAIYKPAYYYFNDGADHYFYAINNTLFLDAALPSLTSTPSTPSVSSNGMVVDFSWDFSASLAGVNMSSGGIAAVASHPVTSCFCDITASVAAGDASASSTLHNVVVEGSNAPLPIIAQTGDTPEGGTASMYTEFTASHIYYTIGDLNNPPADPVTYDAQHNPVLNTAAGGAVTLSPATGRYEIAPYAFTTTPVVIKAVSQRDGNYSAIVTDTLFLTLPAPTIAAFTPDDATSTGSTSIVAPDIAGITVAYTTDDTEPRYTVAPDGTITPAGTTLLASCTAAGCSTQVSSVPAFATVKAVAIKNGWHASPVASKVFYVVSGVVTHADGSSTVVLADLEDHRWSYYSGSTYECGQRVSQSPLVSLNPCNVNIVYYAGGISNGSDSVRAALGMDAGETAVNRFSYYKTLEKSGTYYPYRTIPNPFCKRPATGSGDGKQYYGFNGWIVMSLPAGITLTSATGNNIVVGDHIAAEDEIRITCHNALVPNQLAGTILLQADWAEAACVHVRAWEINLSARELLAQNTYERNFIVVTGGWRTLKLSLGTAKNATIMSVEPDGSGDYRANNCYLAGNYEGYSDVKFEYINLHGQGNTYIANYGGTTHSLIFGRGIYNSSGNVCVSTILGVRSGISQNVPLNYNVRIESGDYNEVYFYSYNTYGRTYSGGNDRVNIILGSDFDRARQDDAKLTIYNRLYLGLLSYFTSPGARTVATIKSGNLLQRVGEAPTGGRNANNIAVASDCFYMSSSFPSSNTPNRMGTRTLIMEGGILANVAGGVDNGSDPASTSFIFRMTGGTIRGSVYGAGAFAAAAGKRYMIVTGGRIKGWLAAGCNGTDDRSAGGVLNGDTYVYVGGKATIGRDWEHDGTDVQYYINYSQGGNVFGAGSGNTQPTTGEVNNSCVVVADNAHVNGNVFGGGNRGYTAQTAQVFILGGVVDSSVYGGSNRKDGTTAIVRQECGQVLGDIFGGSNITGTMSNATTVSVTGGIVGQPSNMMNKVKSSVYGGGRGAATLVQGNVEVIIGEDQNVHQSDNDILTIYGDVYGGSEEGDVNGTAYSAARSTTVKVHRGTIYGDVYGGGYGTAARAANVYGNVTVTVGDASCGTDVQAALDMGPRINGAVYGCNNVNGKPQGTVRINVNGGEMKYVYGGGNDAAYGDGVGTGQQQAPHVVIRAGKIRYNVFGGGRGTGATVDENTDVHVLGRTVVEKNVYGGGNGAEVSGSTHVEIGGNCNGIENKLVP